MKKIIFVIVIILFSTALFYPQKMRNRMMQKKGKLEQLEKVKLIEALDLKEDVAVRFFARRNESRSEIETLENKVDEILVELENTFNSKDKNIETKQKQLVTEFCKTKETVNQKSIQFIKSLNDILTTEQICKLIVFEKKFIEEIRNVLLDKKRQ